MQCPNCNMNIKDDARMCIHCGMQFNSSLVPPVQNQLIVCPNCKANIESGVQFCTQCGSKINPEMVGTMPQVQVSNANDDRYLRAYFGSKYDSVMKYDFSIGTLFFEWIWLLIYGLFKPALNLFLIGFGIDLTATIIGGLIGGGQILSLLGFILRLYFVIQYAKNFSSFRIEKANQEIDEVLRNFQDENERLEMCKKKGKSWFL